MEKFNFFENFKYLLMGGHDEKLKNFEKNFFWIDRANRTRFSETRSLSDQNCMLKNF